MQVAVDRDDEQLQRPMPSSGLKWDDDEAYIGTDSGEQLCFILCTEVP
jgi:hypothetical protein